MTFEKEAAHYRKMKGLVESLPDLLLFVEQAKTDEPDEVSLLFIKEAQQTIDEINEFLIQNPEYKL